MQFEKTSELHMPSLICATAQSGLRDCPVWFARLLSLICAIAQSGESMRSFFFSIRGAFHMPRFPSYTSIKSEFDINSAIAVWPALQGM